MSADPIAAMVPLIREVLSAASDPAASSEMCATFEVTSNTAAWAQVTPGSLNIAYPFADAPLERLAPILDALPDVQLVAFEASKYATFSFDSVAPVVLARVIDDILVLIFALDDYSVDGQLERI